MKKMSAHSPEPKDFAARMDASSLAELADDRLLNCRPFKLLRQVNRRYLLLVAEFCHIQVVQSHSSATDHANAGDNKLQRPPNKSRWPKLILAIYFYCSIRFLVNLCFQYAHDYYQIQLERRQMLDKDNNNNNNNNHSSSIETKLLAHRLHSLRATLEALGAPHLQWSWAVECGYLYVLEMATLGYLATSLYYNYRQPFDFSLMRMFCNLAGELLDQNKLVRRLLGEFDASSRNYWSEQADCNLRLIKLQQTRQFPILSQDYRDSNNNNKLLAQRRRLQELACGGHFRPLNRDAKWILAITAAYLVGTLGYGSLLVLSSCSTWLLAPILFGFTTRTHLMDMLVLIELFLLGSIALLAGIFHLATMFYTTIDLTCYLLRLVQLIRNCVRQNELKWARDILAGDSYRRIYQHRHQSINSIDSKDGDLQEMEQQQQQRHRTRLQDELEMNLLTCLIHFELFKAHSRQLQVVLERFPVPGIILIIVSVPVLVRLHVPYLDDRNKSLAMMASLISALALVISLGPICYLLARCLDLYKQLWSLLAHSIRVEAHEHAHAHAHATASLYDEHSISLLRKELNQPEGFKRRFSSTVLGLEIGFPTLLESLFYLSLLIWSVFVEVNGGSGRLPNEQGAVLSRVLSDPLSILN